MPRVLPRTTAAPSAMPSRAASSGWIITVGRPSRASEVGVSLNVELRKPRDGEVASRNGCSSSASSMMVQWSGSFGICSTGPPGTGLRNGTFGQSGLKRNLPSGQLKPLM